MIAWFARPGMRRSRTKRHLRPVDNPTYFDIAKAYGFANYMFQTNQGPSFPAHQFLFSGTSAPITDGTTNQYLFASENPTAGQNSTSEQGSPTGCLGHIEPTYSYYNVVQQIDPTGSEGYTWWDQSLLGASQSAAGFPCYIHNSIADLLDNAGLQNPWKYYTNDPTSIWTAPNALYSLCGPTLQSGSYTCQGKDWANIIPESSGSNPPNAAQILKDIFSCQLASVSFVTPDGAWSDHAGLSASSPVLGPSWVSAIVNAIGGGMTDSQCNPPGTPKYWNNTVILITWDDWGGWYDHVSPPGVGTGYTGGGGNNGEQYVYGFRVPLLVVSAYTKGQKGYVSGPAGYSQCPPGATQYCHDFGSILNFIEYVFGSGGKSLGTISTSSTYLYADYYALDGPNECPPTTCPYSLSDFFDFSKGIQGASAFIPINSNPPQYNWLYFVTYSLPPQQPDNDGIGQVEPR